MPSPSPATPQPSPAPGSIGHRTVRDRRLASVATRALADELVARIRSEDSAAASTPQIQRFLGLLSAELVLRTRSHENRFSPTRSSALLSRIQEHPDFSWDRLRGATCIDVGCGSLNPLGPLFVLVLHGAARGIGIDADPVQNPALAARAVFDAAAEVWARVVRRDRDTEIADLTERLRSFDLVRLANGDPSGADFERLEFRCSLVHEAGLADGEADIVFSTSFLEHVPDPATVIESLARASRPGALHVHAIDGTDHRRYSDPDRHPLDFYREVTEDPLCGGCNRVPVDDYAGMFEAAGFEIRESRINRRVPLTDEEVATFAPMFRDRPRELLENASRTYFLRRRG